MTDREKAMVIMEQMDKHIQVNNEEMRNTMLEAIEAALEEIEHIEPTRTIAEVQSIVDAVRAGVQVQIDYADQEDENEFVHKACW